MQRTKMALLAGISVAAISLAGAGAAQDAIVAQQSPDELLGGWVVGASVETPDGERIGAIDDITIVVGEGQINAAIISVGGFLGFGAKSIAVDWSELQINWDAREVVLNMSREAMEAAEEYVYRDREDVPLPAGAVGGGDAMGGGGAVGGGAVGGGAVDGGAMGGGAVDGGAMGGGAVDGGAMGGGAVGEGPVGDGATDDDTLGEDDTVGGN